MGPGRAVLCLLAVSGCSLDAVSLDGKRCPCAPGWFCDTATNLCLEGAAPRDGGDDAAPARGDAGPTRDGGPAGIDADPVRRDGGASPVDSGPMPIDAGSPETDAGPPATTCGTVHAGAMFCDGFEDGTEDAWYNSWTRDGTTAIATDRAYRGRYSFLARTDVAAGRAAINTDVIDPTTSGHIYVRAWFYIEPVAVTDISLVQIGESVSPWAHASVSSVGGGTQLFINTTSPTTTRLGAAAPVDEWFCLELHVDVSATAGTIEHWLHGTRETSVTGIDTLPAQGMELVTVGAPYTGPSQVPARIYVDEVVVDDAPIGCD